MSSLEAEESEALEQNGGPDYDDANEEDLLDNIDNQLEANSNSEEDDEDKEEDDEEEEEEASDSDSESSPQIKKSKKKRKKDREKKKKRRRREDDDSKIKKKVRSFFLDKAEVGDDTEDEEEYEEGEEEILGEDELEAIKRVEQRHQSNRQNLSMDAKTLAQSYEERYKSHARMETSFQRAADGSVGVYRQNSVSQQSLIPSVHDPAIFSVRCHKGDEKTLVRSILLKQLHMKNQGRGFQIKSAFHTDNHEYVYIEALAEPLAREAIQGLRGLYNSTFKKVPVNQMTSLLTVQVKKKPLKSGQFVRIRRGPLKGDLAKILLLHEGDNKAIIQAVPRPDYIKEKKTQGSNVRPPQALFSIEEAAAAECDVTRRRMPQLNENMHFWGNDFYRNGFLIKDVTVNTYVTDEDVKPSVEEIQMFREVKNNRDNEYEDFDAKSDIFGGDSSIDNILDSQAMEESEKINFVAGDQVLVASGELKGIEGKVCSVDEVNGLVRIALMHSEISNEVTVEANLLIKNIKPGAHVKVTSGTHLGQTGKVVSILAIDGSHVAAILTDGVNTEISVNVSHLQVTNEVTVGLSNLAGFELYDLVVLNQNETAVVVFVGTESLTVVNHQSIVKHVQPMELKGKKNSQSARTSAFDASHNAVTCGDTVKVTDGPYKNKSGTIKHILKSVLWIHSNSHLKDSGIFVVRSRSCVLSGSKPKAFQSMEHMSAMSGAFGGAKMSGQDNLSRHQSSSRHVKDANVGKDVVVIKGAYKGYLAQILDATETHYYVEVFAKMKKINIEHDKVSMKDEVVGSLTTDANRRQQSSTSLFSQATPYMQGATPMHGSSATPMYTGSETPMVGTPRGSTPRGGSTPSADDAYDPWKISSSHDNSDAYDAHSEAGHSSHSIYTDGNSSWNISSDNYSEMSGYRGSHDNSRSQVSKTVGSEINHHDWPRNTVVEIISQNNALGVLQSKVSKDGTVDIMKMEGGRLVGAPIRFHYEAIVPATPYVGCYIEVMSGRNVGTQGTVSRIDGSDVIVDGSRIVRLQYLLWKFKEE